MGRYRLVAKLSCLTVCLAGLLLAVEARAQSSDWLWEWPDTDFDQTSVSFDEILSGGPSKDGIPAIDEPVFEPAEDSDLPNNEPVLSVDVDGQGRAYPLRVLMWHEIVNDNVGGLALTVTFCPLCNTGLVFRRDVDGQILDFGTTGKLRNSDLVMYDRQTESWWQQFTGIAIVGEMTGTRLTPYPSRLESFALFKERFDDGDVLVPSNEWSRNYGQNPYVGYDGQSAPYGFFTGDLPEGIAPLARVIRVGDRAWALDLLRKAERIEDGDLVITWQPGQASALDSATIAAGYDVGNVVVRRRSGDDWVDEVYTVDFAFAFHAFYPDSVIFTD